MTTFACRILVLVALLMLCAPRPAYACLTEWGVVPVMPRPDDHNVPRNARVWLRESFHDATMQERVRLRTQAGEELAYSFGHLVTGLAPHQSNILVLTPSQLLPANSSIRVVVLSESGQVEDTGGFQFQTSADEDNEAPDLPRETSRTLSLVPGIPFVASDECSGPACTRGTSILVAPEEGRFLVASINERAEFSSTTLAGNVAAFSTGKEGFFWTSPGCGAQDTDQVKFGALDVAGNFSGWGVTTTLGKASRCACSHVGNGMAPGIGLLLLGLVARKRR